MVKIFKEKSLRRTSLKVSKYVEIPKCSHKKMFTTSNTIIEIIDFHKYPKVFDDT